MRLTSSHHCGISSLQVFGRKLALPGMQLAGCSVAASGVKPVTLAQLHVMHQHINFQPKLGPPMLSNSTTAVAAARDLHQQDVPVVCDWLLTLASLTFPSAQATATENTQLHDIINT